MAPPLFRTIRPDAQLLPGIVDLQAPGWAALTAFLALSVLAAAGFVATAPYARKQATIGMVAPQAGTVRVSAPRPGIFAELFVAEGAEVAASAALFRIETHRALAGGGGAHAGTIDSVSASLLTPDEVTGPLRPDGPVYLHAQHLGP